MKNILITGGAGFIGSNFVNYFSKKYPDYNIIILDSLTYAGNTDNIDVLDNTNVEAIHYDICWDLNDIFRTYNITDVIHFAAESHVDNSIESPLKFIDVNVKGTANLLETARKSESFTGRFHHISTDEVYGSLGKEGKFTESTPYAPNSPYSASKASSDFIVRSYYQTYGMDLVITNCSNNYGPHQHDEKLIPKTIKNILEGKPIPIYGTGENVRDWLYVDDHCKAIDVVFHTGLSGESYNIGGNCELTNNQIVNIICNEFNTTHTTELADKSIGDKYQDLIIYVNDRLGHDERYAIDNTKITKKLNWEPEEEFMSGLGKTINYYINKYGRVTS